MEWPDVSIIIPAYNARATIQACVESVLNSAYQGRRDVMVVDDRSTDGTREILARLDCRVILMAENGGPALARNAGAAAARGEILIFVDSDTQMRPDTIVEAVRALQVEGAVAATGMYEAEPINEGFFPAYYAYLKYFAFMSSPAKTINAFGAQCGAVYNTVFHKVGGFRAIPWGMDIENDELGHRLNRQGAVVLARGFRVKHNFPKFKKLLMVFTGRVYWWILFRHYCQRDETVLMTKGFGLATAALPAAFLCLSATLFAKDSLTLSVLLTMFTAGVIAFASGYMDFWRLCGRRRGLGFAAAASFCSAASSLVITASAFMGYSRIGWLKLTRQGMPFAASGVQPA